MSNNIKDTANRKIQGRVLFTGNGELVIDDLMAHINENYQMIKCQPNDLDVRTALKNFKPHVIIMCLSDESRDTLHAYAILQENEDYRNIPVLGIGNKDDCIVFKKNIVQKNTEVFKRPLNRELLIESINNHIASAMEAEALLPEVEEEDWIEIDVAAEMEIEEDDGKEVVKEAERLAEIQGRKTILVVDDDVRMLNSIKLYLQDLYDVVTVPGGKLALKFLAKKSADLVLLDYMMPEYDGPAVLQQIRENSPVPDIPVVFLTGVAEKELVMEGLKLRPRGYLLKPVTRRVLLEKITEILLDLG